MTGLLSFSRIRRRLEDPRAPNQEIRPPNLRTNLLRRCIRASTQRDNADVEWRVCRGKYRDRWLCETSRNQGVVRVAHTLSIPKQTPYINAELKAEMLPDVGGLEAEIYVEGAEVAVAGADFVEAHFVDDVLERVDLVGH